MVFMSKSDESMQEQPRHRVQYLTLLLCQLLQVDPMVARTAVLIAAMAPGINSYLFATLYQRGQHIAASTVLLATASSVVSVSVWLWLLTKLYQ
jgi:malonate transporter and related proteins